MDNTEDDTVIVINDLLSFCWCKLKVLPQRNLLKALKSFYTLDEGEKSLQILIKVIPLKMFHIERISKSKDPFIAILNILKYISGKDKLPVFVCLNLNNIPEEENKTGEKCVKKTLFEEHRNIEIQLGQVFDCLHELKEQFQAISAKKAVTGTSTSNVIEANTNLKIRKKSILAKVPASDDVGIRLIANRHARASMRKTEIKKKCYHYNYFQCLIPLIPTIKEVDTEAGRGVSNLFNCSLCGFSSNDQLYAHSHSCLNVTKETMKYSKETNQPQSSHLNKDYECRVCAASFDTIRSYKCHLATHLESDFRCPLCSERFSEGEWLSHVRLCSGRGGGSLSKEDIYCRECDVFFADKTIMGYHKGYHDPARPFQCLECKFRFYTQKSVDEHFRKHTAKGYKYKCPFCYVRGPGQKKIWEHIRCHTGDKPYKCQVCDHAASNLYNLKCHMRRHSQTKEFKCDLCDKCYKSKSKLNTHKRVHTNAKQYKCPVCGKGFNFGIYMTLHHKRHFDMKTHNCPECSFKATSANLLRKHVSIHTDAKLYKCSNCSFGSNFKSYLNSHLKKCLSAPHVKSED